jgi:hypothetical protein
MTENFKHHRAKQRVTDRAPDAYHEGVAAKAGDRAIDENPYMRGTIEHREWSRGYRAHRVKSSRERRHAELLTVLAQTAAKQVRETSEPHHFDPMNPADRYTVHSVIREIGGLVSESIDEGHRRHVVVRARDRNTSFA